MHGKPRFSRVVKLALILVVGVLLSPRPFRPATGPVTQYVWCGAAGQATGADWTDAYPDLPASLVRGDTYVIAGSDPSAGGCTYGPHTFDDPESGTSLITVRKAEPALDSGIPGWQGSFATTQAVWTVPVNSDPEATTNIILWKVCRSYYTIDGVVGVTDPAAGGPSGFGFLVMSPNNTFLGLINISTNSCGVSGNATLTNVTISHVEVDGVNRHIPAAVTSCSYAGTTATVATSPTSYAWVVGDTVGGWDSSSKILFTNVPIESASGQILSFSLASNPCGSLANLGLDYSPQGIYIFGPGDTYSNLRFSYDYIHDITTSNLVSGGISNSTFTFNFIAKNRSTPTYHAAGMEDHTGSNNISISNNWWEDIQGTAFIEVLNSGTAGASNSWEIYGNSFWETSSTNILGDGSIQCINSNSCSGWLVFNNTFYNISGLHAGIGWVNSSPTSVGNLVYDNMWVDSANVFADVPSGKNVCYDETAACALTAPLVMDYNYYDANTSTTVNDVHGQTSSTAPTALFANAALGNFELLIDTNNLLNIANLNLLPGDSSDPEDHTRAADGTWDAGAFQFTGAAAMKPTPPTALMVTSVH